MRNLVLHSIGRLLLASSIYGLVNPAHAQYEGALPPTETLRPGFESIQPDQCREWLEILAGPTFAGRGTGQPGHVKAAHWIAGKVAEFGLEPMGDDETYFQMLEMNRVFVDDDLSKISGPEGLEIGFSGAVGLDRFSDNPEVNGPLVFLTMKGEAALPEQLELAEKIVILSTDEAGRSGSAVTAVTRQRPLAVLLVTDSAPTSTAQMQGTAGRRRGSRSVSGAISAAAAMSLVTAAGGEASWLELDAEQPAVVHNTGTSIKIELRTREQPMAVPNVLAWLEGSDPNLRHEYVVIGAHLDHLGTRGDAVYPGADDNGSGSTAILSIAKAMTANPIKPKRSVLFIWFAAEEIGLLGSAHYVANPLLPLENMVCMLNIDMVGRNEQKGNETAEENEQTLHLVGSQKGDQSLHDLILDANRHVNFTFEFDEEGVFGRSDQINFFRKGTSVAFLFGGFHPDYHRPTDEPAKINYRKIASAAKLFYVAAHQATEHGPFPVPAAESEQADN